MPTSASGAVLRSTRSRTGRYRVGRSSHADASRCSSFGTSAGDHPRFAVFREWKKNEHFTAAQDVDGIHLDTFNVNLNNGSNIYKCKRLTVYEVTITVTGLLLRPSSSSEPPAPSSQSRTPTHAQPPSPAHSSANAEHSSVYHRSSSYPSASSWYGAYASGSPGPLATRGDSIDDNLASAESRGSADAITS
ncbi:unnamed protein product [Tilletia laevis]|uniref:Uncharacterized protein n=3 Tax=Tilletia TaxID=13289 RepID=A0A8X7N0C8_9BASI|nr:hypothetical protein A4X06_0g522 [Tilletia controversa]KAE8265404.1 hypothetical protein A4X03_0g294 [Tilletia caries]CAD6916459.1 unnamed protein product [Tilletia laevis]CAD6928624.1 unnamed protein product [Tilletia laevis]CAD7066923.1 unnamed protein product [Tilletia caries]